MPSMTRMQACRDCRCMERKERLQPSALPRHCARCTTPPSSSPPRMGNAMPVALDNVVADVCRKQLIADDTVDHRTDFTLGQPIDSEGGHARPSIQGAWNSGRNVMISSTRRLRTRSTRSDRTLASSCGSAQCAAIENNNHRRLPRQRFHLGNKCFQSSLSARLGGHVERRIASVVRQRQHLGEQCRILLRSRGLHKYPVQLVEFRLCCVVVRQPSSALHLTDDWIGADGRADVGDAEDGRPQDRAPLRAVAAGQRERQRRPPHRADQGVAPLARRRNGLRHAVGAHPRQRPARRQQLRHQDQGGALRQRQGLVRPVHGDGSDRRSPGDTAGASRIRPSRHSACPPPGSKPRSRRRRR